MDLACVDKIVKDKNGVKYILVLHDLFDRALDAKARETKGSKETTRAFLTMITKKSRPENIGLTREQSLPESLKNYARLNENNFTLQ